MVYEQNVVASDLNLAVSEQKPVMNGLKVTVSEQNIAVSGLNILVRAKHDRYAGTLKVALALFRLMLL
ncbi:hypothetical protein [Lysinibacillus sp. KU-BSD001]|uniref:hypothetical protein n=1 Tax=Lysinibacillus sp. KU-BSD001 TaxID=3141328 RepID=UPI0036F3AA21